MEKKYSKAKKSLGICIGASTVKLVEIDLNYSIVRKYLKNHDCNPRKTLKEIFNSLNPEDYAYCSVTGRKFKNLINLPVITEPEATEYALKEYIKTGKLPKCPSELSEICFKYAKTKN